MNKIRTKLLLAIALVTLIPLLGLQYYGQSWGSTVIKKVSAQKLETRISVLSAKIEGFLSGTEGDLFLLADAASLRQLFQSLESLDPRLVGAAKANVAQDFISMSRNRGLYAQIRFLDKFGNEIIRIENDGKAITAMSGSQLQNKKSRYYFLQALKLKKGEVLVTPMDLNREHGEIEKPVQPTIRYATPVFDTNNRLQGLVVLNVRADRLLNMVRNAASENQLLVLTNTQGSYLSHPDKTELWGGKTDLNTGAGLKKDYPEISEQILNATGLTTVDNRDSLIVSNPVVIPGSTNHKLGVLINMVPKSVVFASVANFRKLFILLSIIVFALTIGLGSVLAHYITGPIIYLTEAVEGMSRGELDEPIDVDSKDETKQLAVAIERMRKSMKVIIDKYS